MNLKNTTHHFGWVSIGIHWLMAAGLLGIYFLGLYMVTLDYYDTWYHKGPVLHKEIGIILTLAIIFRLFWTYSHTRPVPIETQQWRRLLAKLAHLSLYLITLLLMISGYLISTSKGQAIDVFSIIEVPATFIVSIEQSEFLGHAHDILASLFILMVALHTTAALLHHFIFKDNTLKRMLWAQNHHNNK